MSDNPGRLVTKFQFSVLFWFQTINPATIISGFRKVGVCPFNATTTKPYIDVGDASDEIPSSSSGGSFNHDDNGIPNQYLGNVEGLVHHDEDARIKLFQWRFNNGYDIYDDPLYLDWLRQEHPDSLPAPEHLNQHVDPLATEVSITSVAAS